MNGGDKAVAASSAMLPLVTAQTVAFERGWEDGCAIKNSWGVRLKPLEVESEIQDDLYLIVFSVQIENWTYDGRQC
jgi:hypothetical protein